MRTGRSLEGYVQPRRVTGVIEPGQVLLFGLF